MADKNNDQEKTEEPTSRKLEKAREEGNVSRSAEISSVLLMVVTTIIFYNTGNYLYSRLSMLTETFLVNADQPLNSPGNATHALGLAMKFGFELLTPLLIGLLLTALLVNIAQTGFLFSTKALKPKGNRINPQTGLKRLFSSRGLVELVKGLAKIGVVSLVIYFTVRGEINHFLLFVITPIGTMLSKTGYYILLIVSRILSALLILSIADALYQRYQHKKDLRMTKQEVKDEFKQMEGDPMMKNKRRQMAMSRLQAKRLDHAVLGSDVVVTNPTHYAVALHYDPEQNDAPIVKAKGQRNRALKIREFAREYDIPIIENPPVARALYASADENQYVPPELYQAVAEILAYVYKLKKEHNL